MDDTRKISGEDDEQPFDLSSPQEGEPTTDQPAPETGAADGSVGAADGEPEPETPAAEAGQPTGGASGAEGPRDEAGPDESPDAVSEPAAPAEHQTELPLPLLHELEEAPPVKPEEPPVVAEPETAPEEEGTGRRLSEQWRIDLKWIFGLPATVVLILTLAALMLFRVSGEEVASGIIDDTRTRIVDDSRFSSELSRVDPQLLRMLKSDEFTASLYEDPELFQSMIDAIPKAEEGDPRAGQYDYIRSTLDIYRTLGGTIGKSQHIQARSALIALVLLLVLFGVPYIIFSRRLGKIVSTAVSLGLASWFPFFGLLYLRGHLSDWISNRPGIVEDYQTGFVLGLVDSFANGLVDAALPLYRFCSLVALILLGFGLLGLLVVWWRFNESITPRKKKLRD